MKKAEGIDALERSAHPVTPLFSNTPVIYYDTSWTDIGGGTTMEGLHTFHVIDKRP